jgi:hypothetical protein
VGFVDDLVGVLADLELELGGGTTDRALLIEATTLGWQRLEQMVHAKKVGITKACAKALHKTIAQHAGIPGAGDFAEGEGRDSWAGFSRALRTYGRESADDRDAWVIGQLFGGPHLRSLGITVGWLLVSGLRMQKHQPAIDPDRAQWPEWIRALRGTRPPIRDAEYLRSLLRKRREAVVGSSKAPS